MQKQKDSARKNILITSRHEFLKNGFKNTSMRTIAQKSGVGLSNIYNYFKNKNEIFLEILHPLILAFERLTDTHNRPENITTDWYVIETYQQGMLNDFLKIVSNYQSEIKLLFFHSNGSSLENYTQKLIERHTRLSIEYFELMKQKYPSINDNISPFFLHTASSWWLAIMSEIVSHDELTEQEIRHFIRDFITFGTAGWKKLMQI